jgi:hypothetical protein
MEVSSNEEPVISVIRSLLHGNLHPWKLPRSAKICQDLPSGNLRAAEIVIPHVPVQNAFLLLTSNLSLGIMGSGWFHPHFL